MKSRAIPAAPEQPIGNALDSPFSDFKTGLHGDWRSLWCGSMWRLEFEPDLVEATGMSTARRGTPTYGAGMLVIGTTRAVGIPEEATRMEIAMVGLVFGACFADFGHEAICVVLRRGGQSISPGEIPWN